MDTIKNLEQIFRDHPDLVNELTNAQSTDDLLKAFSQHGFVLSTDEIQELVSKEVNVLSNNELNEEDLEAVSGGRVISTGMNPISSPLGIYALLLKILGKSEKKSGSSGFGHTGGGKHG